MARDRAQAADILSLRSYASQDVRDFADGFAARPDRFPAPADVGASIHKLPSYNPLVSSARLLAGPVNGVTAYSENPQYDQWQNVAWDFYNTLEHLSYGVGWLAKMVSQVRLVAAEVVPGRDEPIPMTDPNHPAVAAVTRLCGGTGGQAQLMKKFTIHLSVPGVCWLVGEEPITDPTMLTNPKSPFFQPYRAGLLPDEEVWRVYSARELRKSSKKWMGQQYYEIRVSGPGGSNQDNSGSDSKWWRPLNPTSMVVKCWSADSQYGWMPTSPTKNALGACTELDLVNKRIMAMILSRLASNGVLLYDKERMSLPVRTNPNDPGDAANSPGDLAQVFVDVAKQAIADPASPSACIPIPIGFSVPELTDVDPRLLMQHITFGEGVDSNLLKMRESAINRVATGIDLPAEIILGMGRLNHWGASQVEQSATKVDVTSIVESITYSLTIGYLYPMLDAADVADPRVGPNGGRVIVWYDPGKLKNRPEKSAEMAGAYDREEVTGTALRREIGAEEADAPTLSEQINMLLRKQARQGSIEALQVLNGDIKLGDVQSTASPGVRPDNAPTDTPKPPTSPSRPGGDTPGPVPRTKDPETPPRPGGDPAPSKK